MLLCKFDSSLSEYRGCTMSVSILGPIKAGSICATLLGLLAGYTLPVETANAQFIFFGSHHRSWPSDYTRPRHKHQYKTKSNSVNEAQPKDAPEGPLQIIISIQEQRISVYDNGLLIAHSSVSTGTRNHPTPLGVFSVISKKRWHRSNIYSAAPMPFMQRITWSGIALHAGVLPGYPASHGCIRLADNFAVRLWNLTKRGTRVIIARDDVRPLQVTNPNLFVSKSTVSGSPESQVGAVAADSVTTATYAPLSSNVRAPETTSLQIPMANAVGPQNGKPISIFVSRKLGKLLVRQGSTPLFDAPIKIQNQDEPLGTHVFTAMASQNEVAVTRWTVVSVSEEYLNGPAAPTKSHKQTMKRIIATAPSVPTADKANVAFNRIEIPTDVVERISELLTPGSSLILSDHGLSDETGKDTDFIVETY
jgi:L,D-transpeptidase-like protein